MRALLIGLVGLMTFSAGCAGAIRSDDIYSREVKELLETKGGQVSNCWGDARKTDPTAMGTVTVTFRVAEDTGAIENPAVDASGTTAPEPIQQCVLASLEGLALSPPDTRPANATYVWELGAP